MTLSSATAIELVQNIGQSTTYDTTDSQTDRGPIRLCRLKGLDE